MTDNHNYKTPSKGQTNWHLPLNSNFENLDTDVEIRDTEDNRGSYRAKAGAKFLATDTESAFVGDGDTWRRLDSRGQRSSFQSVRTDQLFSQTDNRTGALLIDGNEDYRAVSFPTEEVWTHSSDAGVVLQKLADALAEASRPQSGERLGEVAVGDGIFDFSTTVVLNNHLGLGLSGQSRKQTNQWSPTVFKNAGISEGRGILEYGNVGRSSPGSSAGSFIERVFFDGSGGNIHPIYVWGQDRTRLTDVKVDNIGPRGHGILYFDSYNTTWSRVYAIQAAHLTDTGSDGPDKGTNSFRMDDCTFNTNNEGVPTFVGYGDGWRLTQSVWNSKDVANGQSAGIPTFSGNPNHAVAAASDSRLGGSGHDIEARFAQMQFVQCQFNGGNSSTILLDVPVLTRFVSCAFKNAETVIREPNMSTILGCEFDAGGSGNNTQTMIDMSRDSNTLNDMVIANNAFKDYKRVGIRTGDRNHDGVMISGNTFRSGNTGVDIDLHRHTSGVFVVTNFIENSIEEGDDGFSPGSLLIPPVVQHNQNYNPIGFGGEGRSAPSVPSVGNRWTNEYGQHATVYLDGSQSGTTLYTPDGQDITERTDASGNRYIPSPVLDQQNSVVIPPLGAIEFATPPDDWGVQWQ